MVDCAVLASGPGYVRIQSSTLFGDVNHPLTKSFLSCLLDADPSAQIEIRGGGIPGRQAIAEIRHSQPSPGRFLLAVVGRMRSLVGVSTKSAIMPAAETPQSSARSKKAKSSSKVLVGGGGHVADAHQNGHADHEISASEDSHGNRAAVSSSIKNGKVNGANGSHDHSVPPKRAVERPRVSLIDAVLLPDRKGVFRIARNGTHATTWEIIHELPGRMRLKHPAMYRRKEVCQGIERELMSILGVDSYKARPSTGTLLITYNKRELRKDQVLSILDRAIARAELSTRLDPPDLDFPLAVASVPFAAIAQFAVPPLLPAAGLLFAYTSVTTFKEAYNVLFHERRLGVDVLDAIVVTGCVLTGQIFAGSVLCLCLSFGECW